MLSVVNLCWLQPVHVRHSLVFCLSQAFQNIDHPTDSLPSLKHLCHIFICAALITSSPGAFWLIPIVSVEECSSFTQNWIQICCSTCSVILNAVATRHTPPPSLTGTVKLSLFTMHIPSHSPWLPRYINVVQTILVILTMAGLFLDKPCMLRTDLSTFCILSHLIIIITPKVGALISCPSLQMRHREVKSLKSI